MPRVLDAAFLVVAAQLALAVQAQAAPPAVSGAAAPAVVNRGDSVLLTVAVVTTQSNGMFRVASDLSLIGGSQTAEFNDSGTGGDPVAGDRVFSYRVTVAPDAGHGQRSLLVSVSYDFGLADFGQTTTQIALTVGVPPAVTTAATPSTAGLGDSVLFTVTVAPRAVPGLSIEADFQAIGGGTREGFNDAGVAGDLIAGDRVFSRRTNVGPSTIEGPKILPVLVEDAAGVAFTSLALTVVAPPAPPTATAVVTPSALEPQTWARMEVTVAPGTGPRSTNLVVTADLSRFGLPTNARLANTGVGSCDLSAFDAIYSACFVVPRGVALGQVTVQGQVADAQGRVAPFSTTATIAASGDRDGDGLTNACEQLFGLNADSAAGNDGAAGDPDGDGATNAQECAAETHPRGAIRRYLAEGAANDFFRTRLALFNPASGPAIAWVRVQPEGEAERRVSLTIPAESVRHLTSDDLRLLAGGPFSTLVESDRDLVVDRTMTWGEGDYGGHVETAARAPSTTWFFAEGATGWRFSLFYLLQNPGDAPAEVQVQYLRGAGQPVLTRTYVVPPHARRTIAVDDEEFPAGSGQRPLAATDVAARLEVTNGVPIVAERAMYMSPDGQPFGAGHDAMGATAAATRWFFAEGSAGSFFDEFLLVANPGSTPATVQVTFTSDQLSTPRTHSVVVAPNSRRTVYVDELFGIAPFSNAAELVSDVPIVAERAMWWPGSGESWREAHVSLGANGTSARWGIAGLEIGGPRDMQSFVLVSSTGNTLVRVYSPFLNAPVTCALVTAGRTTVHMNTCLGLTGVPLAAVIVEGPPDTVVEWSTYSGDGTGAGGGAFATPLP